MVDTVMLDNVKKVLEKVEEYRNNSVLLKDSGIDVTTMSEEEIIKAILNMFFTESEIACYNKYMEYKRQQDLRVIAGVLDSLNNLTNNVNGLYEERRDASNKIVVVNEMIRKLKMRLMDVPKIRISTLYGHLEFDYNKYSKAAIKGDMTESKFNDRIYALEHRSSLIRHMTQKELARVKKELSEFKARNLIEVEEYKQKYLRTKGDYIELLRTVVYELLRNEEFLNAMMLSTKDIYGLEIGTTFDSKGLPRVVREDLKEANRVAILNKFFEYFEQHNNEKYDADTFCQLLEEYIFYAYRKYISGLERKKEKCLSDIRSLFQKQGETLDNIKDYQRSLNYSSNITPDQEDTFALVYNPNK